MRWGTNAMRNYGEFLISVVFLAIVLGCVYSKRHTQEIVPIRCEEDQPCWDCETMGNKICGPNDPGPVDLAPKVHGSGTGKGNSTGTGRADGYGAKRARH